MFLDTSKRTYKDDFILHCLLHFAWLSSADGMESIGDRANYWGEKANITLIQKRCFPLDFLAVIISC